VLDRACPHAIASSARRAARHAAHHATNCSAAGRGPLFGSGGSREMGTTVRAVPGSELQLGLFLPAAH